MQKPFHWAITLTAALVLSLSGCSNTPDKETDGGNGSSSGNSAVTYTVTFDSRGGSEVSNKTVTTPSTTLINLPADPIKTGYLFGGWFTSTNGGGLIFTTNSSVTANITVYAKWNNYSYTVVYDSQGGTTVSSTLVNSPATTVVNLPIAPNKAGSSFAGWWSDVYGTGVEFTSSTTVASNITVYAKWTANPVYTVSYNSDGGSAIGVQHVTLPDTTVVTLPSTPTKTGYLFGGWFTAANGGGTLFTENTMVTTDITVYAKWNNYNYSVTFNSDGGSAVASKAVASPATTIDTLPAQPTKTGYIFGGWYTAPNGGGVVFNSNNTVSADTTVYAKWLNYSYTVVFDDQGATTSVDPFNKTVASPALFVNTLPAVPLKTGYTFGGWYTAINGGGTAFTASSTVISDITVYAKWNSYSYTVTFNSQDATTDACPSNKIVMTPATTIDTLPSQPIKTGSSFAGWWTGVYGAGTEYTANTVVTSDITVYAKWTVNPVYTVTYNCDGGTAVGTQHVTLPATTVETLPAEPVKTGYIFGGWYTAINGGGTPFTASTPVNSDLTIYAKWNSYSYSVNYDSQGGSVVGSDAVNSPAITINSLPTAPDKTGYLFGGWHTAPNGAGTVFTATNIVSNNTTVFAKWNSYNYTVFFDSQGGTAISSKTVASPSTTIDVLPTEPTRTGYIFGGWFTAPNGGGSLFNESTIVTINTTVYAKWNSYSYSISFNSQGGSPVSSKTITSPAVTIDSMPVQPTLPGFRFVGWYSGLNGTGTMLSTNIIIDNDITFYAKWDQYVISTNAGLHGSIISVGNSALPEYSFTPDAGYQVDSVLIDGTNVGPISGYQFININSDHTLSVTFKKLSFQLSATSGLHGSCSPSNTTNINYGDNLTYFFIPDTGYQVDYIEIDEINMGSASAYSFTNIQSPHTVYAAFKLLQYNLTASAGIHGTISPSGNTFVNYGDTQLYTFTPDSNYQIDTVFVDGVNKGTITSFAFTNIQSAHTINVSFKPKTGSVSLNFSISNPSYQSITFPSSDVSIARGQVLNLTTTNSNLTGLTGWEWYVDNTLVADQTSSSLSWDTSGFQPGQYIINVNVFYSGIEYSGSLRATVTYQEDSQ